MFAIRITNKQDQGVGHLMRMRHLADALKEQQVSSCIILDSVCPFSQSLFSEFDVTNVNWSDYQKDAAFTIALMRKNNLSHIIIDSYTLGIEYEQLIKNAGFVLTVIDDIERQHLCDFLIDYKWIGTHTKYRYQTLVPSQCIRLLGPEYCILDPSYRIVNKKCSLGNFPVRLLCSLGGGGDLLVLKNIFDGLPRTLKENIHFDIVVGPYAINKKAIYQIGKKYSNVNILENVTCLKEYYEKASLFIGALGTSFYECAATHTPAITFSFGDNQTNDVSILEWLGHYLHVNDVTQEDFLRVSRLIDTVVRQIPRLNSLVATKKVSIDAFGSSRIANALINGKIVKDGVQIDSRDIKSLGELADDLSMFKVDDTHVNSYLAARNLPSNSEKMTVQSFIKPLEHYLWWFNQSRSNFVLTAHEGKSYFDKLYIWHDVYQNKYLYGGWFACCKDISLPIAMLALKWQLEFCKKDHPNAIWLAVIHKNNKFVNLLNKYMGFVATPIDSREYQATQELFPLADEQFNFVMWDPNAK